MQKRNENLPIKSNYVRPTGPVTTATAHVRGIGTGRASQLAWTRFSLCFLCAQLTRTNASIDGNNAHKSIAAYSSPAAGGLPGRYAPGAPVDHQLALIQRHRSAARAVSENKKS